MYGFGSRMFASRMLETIFRNIYQIIIGKLFSPAALGFYTRAISLQRIPSESLSRITSRVTFPVFASIQDDPERMKRGMRKALTMLLFLNIPMMIGLALVAKPLVLVLLTEKWAPSIPYIQLLCIVGLLYPLHLLNLNILIASGRSDFYFRLELLKKILIVISIAVTYRWGISAMIYGQIVVSFFSYYLNSYYTGKLINYPLKEQVIDFAPYLLISAVMGFGTYTVQLLPIHSNIILLVSQTLIGIAIYAVLNVIFKTASFIETLNLLNERIIPLIKSDSLKKKRG